MNRFAIAFAFLFIPLFSFSQTTKDWEYQLGVNFDFVMGFIKKQPKVKSYRVEGEEGRELVDVIYKEERVSVSLAFFNSRCIIISIGSDQPDLIDGYATEIALSEAFKPLGVSKWAKKDINGTYIWELAHEKGVSSLTGRLLPD